MLKSQACKTIDMVVEMPKDLFEEKDYANMRYFYRRAYFLAYIADALKLYSAGRWDLEFEYLHGNLLLPVLVLRAGEGGTDTNGMQRRTEGDLKRKGKARFAIRIIPIAPWGLFPATKLLPSCNRNKQGSGEENKGKTGTPFYNSSLKADSTFLQYLGVITQAKQNCPAFADACILGRTWLQQRGFGSSIAKGGFGHFEWSAMNALLLQLGRNNSHAGLSSSLSSTELFKAALQFLASSDFVKKPFVFGSYKAGVDSIKETGPVLYDAARELNIAFKMTPGSMFLLQYHARSTLELLGNPTLEQFEPTFIAKADMPQLMFDSVVEVELEPSGESDGRDGRGALWNCCDEIYKTLKRALSSRAHLIHIGWAEPGSWGIASTAARPAKATAIVGVIFDGVNMARRMEHGPSKENEKEANKFRAFWGEKSELRKFKEHGIIECIEWSQGSAFEIFEEITRYVLQLRLSIPPTRLKFLHSNLPKMHGFSVHDKASFDVAGQAFRDFEKHLRNLNGMPLQIRRLSPVCPSLRYSALQAPFSVMQGGSIDSMEVVLYFEVSSQWPENLVAIQETKLDFLLDIARRLDGASDSGSTTLGSLTSTYLGRDDAELGVDNLGYLDVVYESRFAFRIRVHSDAEELFLERQVMNVSLGPQARIEAAEALANFRWLYNQLPLHSQAIATFCTRFAALSPTIRLAKRWFLSQKLARHFSEELIEVLVLNVFLNPHPWRTPTSVSTGFCRFLYFLSRWDWKDEPVIVDVASDLSTADRKDMLNQLESWRTRDPNRKQLVLFVATSYVKNGLEYTRLGPSNMAAMRMTGLAKRAADAMKQQGSNLDVEALFKTQVADYPVIINISSKTVKSIIHQASSGSTTKQSRFKNLDSRTGKSPIPVSRHPVDAFLGVLEDKYRDSLTFFSGGPDDTCIGAVWTVAKKEKFRVGLRYNVRAIQGRTEERDEVEANKEAVLAEISRIGGHLIKRIELVGE